MPAARAPIRQPSHGHLKTKKEAEHKAGITENGRLTRSLKFAKTCTRKTTAELQRLKVGDKLRLSAQAGQMPAASNLESRAVYQQPWHRR